MTNVGFSLKIERILGDPKYVRLIENFHFYSDILGRWVCIPQGFVYDEESIPLVKGCNPEAGAVHDYLCRIDSDPKVSKSVAAQVYYEIQDYFDEQESGNFFNRTWDKFWRYIKTITVNLAPDYFHKLKVNASYEQVKEAA